MNGNMSENNITGAKKHLEGAGQGYLEQINGIDLAHLAKYKTELNLLKAHIGETKSPVLVSLGSGNGIEAHALNSLGGPQAKIVAIDLSIGALQVAQRHIHRFNLDESIIPVNASGLEVPLANESVDGYAMSAILHEVFSYVPAGLNALKTAVREALRVTRGAIYIKDFATVENPQTEVTLSLIDDFTIKFYKLFKNHYRKFEIWSNKDRQEMLAHMDDLYSFPDLQDNKVTLPAGWASEFLMHLRNAYNDFMKGALDLTDKGIIAWKEINEQYHPSIRGNVLSPNQYQKMVMDIAESDFPDRGLDVKESKVTPKQSNERALGDLVEVVGEDAPSIAELTAKMYLVIGS